MDGVPRPSARSGVLQRVTGMQSIRAPTISVGWLSLCLHARRAMVAQLLSHRRWRLRLWAASYARGWGMLWRRSSQWSRLAAALPSLSWAGPDWASLAELLVDHEWWETKGRKGRTYTNTKAKCTPCSLSPSLSTLRRPASSQQPALQHPAPSIPTPKPKEQTA